MSSFSERDGASRKASSRSEQTSQERQSATSNEVKVSQASISWNRSPEPSAYTPPPFSLLLSEQKLRTQKLRTKTNSSDSPLKGTNQRSTREPSLQRQTRRQGTQSNGIPALEDREWHVKLTDQPASFIATVGYAEVDLNPQFAELIELLEFDPQQFPELSRKLDGLRLATLVYNGAIWAIPFSVDEKERIVTLLRIDPYVGVYETYLPLDYNN
jgi:hypothetical protein